MNKKLNIYVDGSENPHSENKIGGYGMIILDEESNPPSIVYAERRSKIGTTNNEQELTAMLSAFNYIMADILKESHDYEIFCDSSYTIKSITEWADTWAKNGWINTKKQQVANLELVQRLYRLYKKENFKITKVAGHSDNIGNELADALATKNFIKFKKIADRHSIRIPSFIIISCFVEYGIY